MPATSNTPATERTFQITETEWVTLADGTRLAARIWLPESATRAPVPAILEYLPYRRRDGTSLRDDLSFPFLARHGYAGVRVDIRGTGDSTGFLEDEYTVQELNDGVEVIHWIAKQEWCCGRVGMLGISWGGFNGLQIASLAPEPLKAVVTVCSTDDRYADDIHYKGGCLLNDNAAWSHQMLSYSSRPPDPAVVGDKWRRMWIERLERMPLLAANWLQHQRRDDFWKHGSVCEDFGSIKAAVLVVCGWADAYTDAAFRVLKGLSAPCHAIVGPWEHAYPHIARTGPRIDFLGETVAWWNQWLKDDNDKPGKRPKLTVFIKDGAPPNRRYRSRDGHWRTFPEWPSPLVHTRLWHLNADGLGTKPQDKTLLTIASPLDTGAATGNFCPGMRVDDELPGDQGEDDARSLSFETPPFDRQMTLLGAPLLHLELAADKPVALVAARLCDVAPDGASTLVSWEVLNLAHRDSRENPSPLKAGETVAVRLEMNHVGITIARGHRLRLALSNAYWPMVWPAPVKNRLTLTTGASTLTLPLLKAGDTGDGPGFRAPPPGSPPVREIRREPECGNTMHRTTDGSLATETFNDFGSTYNPALDLEAGSSVTQRFVIHPDDPLSARASAQWVQTLSRGGWIIRTHTRATMRANRERFHLQAELEAYEGEKLVFKRNWDESIKRDLV